jgi:hypothetical protein
MWPPMGPVQQSYRMQDETAYHPNICFEFDNDVAVCCPLSRTDFPGRMPDLKIDLVGLWLGLARRFHFTLLESVSSYHAASALFAKTGKS